MAVNAAGLEPRRPASLFHFIPRRSSDRQRPPVISLSRPSVFAGTVARFVPASSDLPPKPRCHGRQQFINHIGVAATSTGRLPEPTLVTPQETIRGHPRPVTILHPNARAKRQPVKRACLRAARRAQGRATAGLLPHHLHCCLRNATQTSGGGYAPGLGSRV